MIMKIKRKVQKNLSQLIEWAMDNEIKDRMFLSKCYCVGFDRHGYIYFNSITTIPLDTMFTVEVEEEITEETHLDYLYALTNDDEKEIHRCMNFTIRKASMVIRRNNLTFFTLIDNDLVKIYENGKLVE